jgi:GT2 family glycosyltransferase
LRLQAGIHSAICWIDEPAHTSLPYILRNSFGWKIASSLQQEAGVPNPRCDLQIDPPLVPGRFTEVQAAVQGLFPKVSLIILTYNNLDYTRQCLESIFSKTIYPNYEIVVVDNASTDGTPDYLQTVAATHPNMRLVLNKENRGFAAGNNQGVAAASGAYIAYLNNDIVVTPGWLSGLLTHLSDPAIGAVGPVTNYAGNESRIAVDYHNISDLDDFARRYTRAHAGQSFEIRMLALFCMLLRRSVIEAVGPLDEQFGVGMYEDDDFSLRIRQKGYRILCAEDVYIHHWGSAAFSRLAQERFERLHLENRGKFESKWGTLWQPHRWRMDEV